MKKYLFSFVILFSAFFSMKGQKDNCGKIVPTSENEDFISVPIIYCMQDDKQIVYVKEKLKEFSLEIFDRWGNLIAKSDKEDFSLSAETTKKTHIENYATYIYRIRLVTLKGEKQELTGHLIITNECCSG